MLRHQQYLLHVSFKIYLIKLCNNNRNFILMLDHITWYDTVKLKNVVKLFFMHQLRHFLLSQSHTYINWWYHWNVDYFASIKQWKYINYNRNGHIKCNMTVTVTADCYHLTVNQTEEPYIILFKWTYLQKRAQLTHPHLQFWWLVKFCRNDKWMWNLQEL